MITYDLTRVFNFKCGECGSRWQMVNIKKPWKIVCPSCAYESKPINNEDLVIRRVKK